MSRTEGSAAMATSGSCGEPGEEPERGSQVSPAVFGGAGGYPPPVGSSRRLSSPTLGRIHAKDSTPSPSPSSSSSPGLRAEGPRRRLPRAVRARPRGMEVPGVAPRLRAIRRGRAHGLPGVRGPRLRAPLSLRRGQRGPRRPQAGRNPRGVLRRLHHRQLVQGELRRVLPGKTVRQPRHRRARPPPRCSCGSTPTSSPCRRRRW